MCSWSSVSIWRGKEPNPPAAHASCLQTHTPLMHQLLPHGPSVHSLHYAFSSKRHNPAFLSKVISHTPHHTRCSYFSLHLHRCHWAQVFCFIYVACLSISSAPFLGSRYVPLFFGAKPIRTHFLGIAAHIFSSLSHRCL